MCTITYTTGVGMRDENDILRTQPRHKCSGAVVPSAPSFASKYHHSSLNIIILAPPKMQQDGYCLCTRPSSFSELSSTASDSWRKRSGTSFRRTSRLYWVAWTEETQTGQMGPYKGRCRVDTEEAWPVPASQLTLQITRATHAAVASPFVVRTTRLSPENQSVGAMDQLISTGTCPYLYC